jgi:predicted sugar kinase
MEFKVTNRMEEYKTPQDNKVLVLIKKDRIPYKMPHRSEDQPLQEMQPQIPLDKTKEMTKIILMEIKTNKKILDKMEQIPHKTGQLKLDRMHKIQAKIVVITKDLTLFKMLH